MFGVNVLTGSLLRSGAILSGVGGLGTVEDCFLRDWDAFRGGVRSGDGVFAI